VVHAPVRMSEEARTACLADYRRRMLSLASAPLLPRLDIAAYEGLVLKAGAAAR